MDRGEVPSDPRQDGVVVAAGAAHRLSTTRVWRRPDGVSTPRDHTGFSVERSVVIALAEQHLPLRRQKVMHLPYIARLCTLRRHATSEGALHNPED